MATPPEETAGEPHELVERFAANGMPLNTTLVAMLGEDPVHRTERRGCGYTQATRHLATRINEPRNPATFEDLSLFTHWRDDATSVWITRRLGRGLGATWRNWDEATPDPPADAGEPGDDDAAARIAGEAERQATLRAMHERVKLEESQLLAALIRDIVLPVDANARGLVEAPSWPEKLEVGSCPTAEKCFLELAHGFIPRKGRCNVLVDTDERPVLVEKRNMGDNHSCVSLEPLALNGVRIPPGALFAVHYDESTIISSPSTGPFPGQTIRLDSCLGLRMLRLTTLAISPANRARAFTTHFDAQVSSGLFEPERTVLDQLRHMAHSEVA